MSAAVIAIPAAAAVAPQQGTQSQFNQTLAGLQAEYNPQNTIERQLCRQIADSWCRLQRAAQLETDLFNAYSDFLEIADALQKLTRYRTSIEREWHKCIDQLTKIQERRRKAEAQATKQPAEPKKKKESPLDALLKRYLFAPMPGESAEAEPDEEDSTDEPREIEVGFVSQNPESA